VRANRREPDGGGPGAKSTFPRFHFVSRSPIIRLTRIVVADRRRHVTARGGRRAPIVFVDKDR
jgi:hypothetical protein